METLHAGRTWAEISLSALTNNYNRIRTLLPPEGKLMAVVKAEGYGHGAIPAARHFCALGADMLGVACLDEALALREAGLTTSILILGYTPPRYTDLLLSHDIVQTVYDRDQAYALSARAGQKGHPLPVHIKLDTGMSRLGLVWGQAETKRSVEEILRLPNLRVEGVFSHLASSEVPDDPATREQLEQFESLQRAILPFFDEKPLFHCANSGAVINYPCAHYDMVRTGLLLYGFYDAPGFQPAMRMCSVISQVKDLPQGARVSYNGTFTAPKPMRAAIVAAGYADGVFRSLSNRGFVLIHGRLAPIIGNVCMDMCVVDVSEWDNVHEGDVVTLFGSDGLGTLPVAQVAQLAGTISYEILCSVGRRVPRVYDGKIV